MNDTTFLIRGGIVLPLEGRKVSHDPGSVLVVDGTIAAVGAVEDVDAHPAAAAAPVVEAANHVVIPGMHNAHLHSGLLRGTAESLALFDWLENYVDPAHRALTPEIAKAASYMAYTECLRGGTTSVLDMWRFMEGSAEAAEQIGIRATLAPYTADRYNDVNGMLLGARSVNPEAVVETVLVSTFFDPQKAAPAANALLDNGVGFLFGVMDEPTFLTIAEEAGVWTGYWNLDFRSAAPTKYVSHYDLSEFGTFYIEQCQRVLDGTWTSQSEVRLLDTPLGALGDNVPQGARDAVADVTAQFDSGALNVYEGPLVDNTGEERLAAGASLDSLGAYAIDWAVEGVKGV